MDYAKIKRPSTLIGVEAPAAELVGLQPESLLDLEWTDATLGHHGYAYWPVVDSYSPLAPEKPMGHRPCRCKPRNVMSFDSGQR